MEVMGTGSEDKLVPLIRRLATGDYNSTHIAAAPLFATVYPSVSAASQAEMRTMFAQLCKDDIPMVRKAACQSLGAFGQVVSSSHLLSDLIPLFAKLASDYQDSVRIVAVENCVTLGKILSPEQSQQLILPIIRQLQQDKGWRSDQIRNPRRSMRAGVEPVPQYLNRTQGPIVSLHPKIFTLYSQLHTLHCKQGLMVSLNP